MKTVKRGLGILLVFMLSAMLFSCSESESAPSDKQIKKDVMEYWKSRVWVSEVTDVKIIGKSTEGNNCEVLTEITTESEGVKSKQDNIKFGYKKYDTGWKLERRGY